MEKLRQYLNSLPRERQAEFCDRCQVNLGYLRKAICLRTKLDARLSVSIERESNGAVKVEDVRPDVDWTYLRKSTHGQNLDENLSSVV